MSDFYLRIFLVVLAIVGFYALASIAAITCAQAVSAIAIRRRFGYSWATAWGIARTNSAIDKQLNARRNHA